jgi:hypothetical protein
VDRSRRHPGKGERMSDIHSCSYYCTRTACVLAQRDELRDKLEQAEPVVDGNTSDGYHTFNELYDFRMSYNAALFNEWAESGKHFVHKSYRHHDGELCFGGGRFVVGCADGAAAARHSDRLHAYQGAADEGAHSSVL